MRGDVITHEQKLVIEECFNCHVTFAMTKELRDQKLANKGQSFYCPNGHAQHYVGETEEQRLRKQLENANNLLVQRQNRIDSLNRERETLERSNRAVKAHSRRIKHRAAAGVCPAGCKRHFTNLQRHIETKHPTWKSDEEKS